MSEFIEFLSPSALSEMEKANAELVKMVVNVKSVQTEMAKINTPSGGDAAVKQLTAQYQEQAKAIKDLQTQVQKLTEAKQKQKTLSLEEKVVASQQLKIDKEAALAVSALTGAYQKLSLQRKQAAANLQNLIASEKASTAEIKKAQREYDILTAKVAKADQAIGKMSTSNSLKGLTSQVSNLVGAFGVAGGIYLFAQVAKDVYETTKRLQSLDLALRMVSGTQAEFASNQVFLTQLAEQYGIEIKGLTKNFTEFWVASKGKLEAEQIKDIFTSISKSVAVMGLSVEQQDSAFLALQQMMSKGTVQAEELKKQLGNALPGAIKAATMAYQALHPELKVTEKFFMEQMKAGKVLSSELLPELAKAYEKLYGIENVTRANTLMAAQERLSNSWTNMVRAMNEGDTGGISSFFKIVIDGLTTITTLAGMLFKGESALQKQFQSIGAGQAADELNKYREQFKEYSDETKKFMDEEYLDKQRINIIEQQKIIKEQQELRKTLIGGNRAFLHLQTKAEEDALVSLGKSSAIIKLIKEENIKLNKKPITPTIPPKETEKERKAREKREKDYQDFLENLRKNNYNREMSDLERRLKLAKDNYENKKNLGNDYITFAFQISEIEMEIIKKRYDEEMRLAKKNGKNEQDILNLQKIATNKYHTEQENAFKKHLETLDSIKYDNKNDVKDTGALADQETYGSGVFILDPERYKGMVEGFLKVQEAAGKTKEEIAKLKEGFDNFFNSFTSEFLNNSGFGQLSQMFFEIDENGKTMFENLMEYAKTTETVWDDLGVAFVAFAEVAQEVMNKLAEAEDEKLANKISNLERERDVALAFAGENVAAQEEIQRQFNERKHQAELKAFENKKKIAKANVIIDTAQAIIGLYAENNWVTATILGAILTGIAGFQIAQINAQQPPSYEFGTDNHEGGLMKINDQKGSNYKEAVQTPDGKIRVYNERNKILNAPKGTKVFTATETSMMFNDNLNSMLLNNGISMPKVEINNNSALTESQVNSIVSAIKSKETVSMNIGKDGLNMYVRNGHTTKEIMNKRINFQGNKV